MPPDFQKIASNPVTIKGILNKNPLVLAPLAGITDFPFRILCKELGAGIVFSEMLSAEALIREHRRTKSMLHTTPGERPLVFQIFGAKPASMAEAAHLVSRSGPDFIDINMGCPVPKVVKSGSGSGLLRDMGLAREIMAAVVSASAVPVTVKIRLGWDARSIVAVDYARIAQETGIAAVTVHARTKAQAFSGSADWNMIRTVKENVSIPIIGNGDVRSARDAKRMMDETGCDGVMIGRAVQGNPWLFREAKHFLETGELLPGPTYEERQSVMLRHLDSMVEITGEQIGVREMRKHLCWYTKGLPGGAEFRTSVNRLDRKDDVLKAVHVYFASLMTLPVFI